MGLNINYMYQWVQFLIRKNQTGQVTPKEFGEAINSASYDLWDLYIGPIEQFKPGKPVPTVGLGMSNRIAERLVPFKKSLVPITVTAQNAPYPDDLEALVWLATPSMKRIERIDDLTLSSRLSSVIDPIGDGFRDCYVESETGWTIYPSTLTSVLATYYTLPTEAVWAYTTVNGRPVYDPVNSVDLQWDALSAKKIMGRALDYMGFSFTARDIVEAGMEVKKTGSM